jgi:hypothetical protein
MNRESKVLWTRRWFVFGVVLCAALVSTAWPRYSLAQNEKAPAQDEKVAAEKAEIGRASCRERV